MSEDDPPDPDSSYPYDHSWYKAIELQRALLKIAGSLDCRKAYEENLRDAKEMAAYCRELVTHLERGGQGTRCDPQSRREDLERANAEVAYPRKLLAELDEVRKPSR